MASHLQGWDRCRCAAETYPAAKRNNAYIKRSIPTPTEGLNNKKIVLDINDPPQLLRRLWFFEIGKSVPTQISLGDQRVKRQEWPREDKQTN